MNPTISQLSDPEWWNLNAPKDATHWCENGRLPGFWYRKNPDPTAPQPNPAWLHKRPDAELSYQTIDLIKRSKYHREIKPGVWIDVYDVIKAWAVDNPAQQHLIKKALQAGDRGHKSYEEDMEDIITSAVRAKQLNAE